MAKPELAQKQKYCASSTLFNIHNSPDKFIRIQVVPYYVYITRLRTHYLLASNIDFMELKIR